MLLRKAKTRVIAMGAIYDKVLDTGKVLLRFFIILNKRGNSRLYGVVTVMRFLITVTTLYSLEPPVPLQGKPVRSSMKGFNLNGGVVSIGGAYHTAILITPAHVPTCI